MLVQKRGTDDLYAMKSIRKEDIIQKDQIEHTKTERKILEYVFFFQKFQKFFPKFFSKNFFFKIFSKIFFKILPKNFFQFFSKKFWTTFFFRLCTLFWWIWNSRSRPPRKSSSWCSSCVGGSYSNIWETSDDLMKIEPVFTPLKSYWLWTIYTQKTLFTEI